MAMMRRRDDDTSAEGRLGENRGGVTAHGAGIHPVSRGVVDKYGKIKY